MPRKRNSRRRTVRPVKRRLTLPATFWRRLRDGTLVLVLLAAVYSGTLWVLDQPVSSVKVEAPFQRISPVQVEAAISPWVEQGFLGADLERIRLVIAELDWVEHVAVRRSWPASLHITIREERAAARWGEQGLLNVYGELFVAEASHIPAELPVLSGPEGTERLVAERYFTIQRQLQQRGLNAMTLHYDRRGSWELGISNGMKVRFGTTHIDERTVRFFKALDRVLAGMADRVHYIDMRYTNGFAVGWKPSDAVKLAETGASGTNVW